MNLDDLKKVRYTIGVAGGIQKTLAILGALRGGLINTLITNLATANDILEKDLIIAELAISRLPLEIACESLEP